MVHYHQIFIVLITILPFYHSLFLCFGHIVILSFSLFFLSFCHLRSSFFIGGCVGVKSTEACLVHSEALADGVDGMGLLS